MTTAAPALRALPAELAARPRAVAVAGALTIAFSSILVRLSHTTPSTSALFRCVYALPILAVLAWREDRRLGPRPVRDRRLALAAGVFLGLDLLFWHRSIADIGAGLGTVLANLQVAAVPLLAWAVLGERPARRLLARCRSSSRGSCSSRARSSRAPTGATRRRARSSASSPA